MCIYSQKRPFERGNFALNKKASPQHSKLCEELAYRRAVRNLPLKRSLLLVDALLTNNLPLLLDEVTTRFEQVTRLQYHSLGFGDNTEEEHSCA